MITTANLSGEAGEAHSAFGDGRSAKSIGDCSDRRSGLTGLVGLGEDVALRGPRTRFSSTWAA